MGKKNRDQEPTPTLNNVNNRDIIQRINFLYQASTYLSTIAATPPSPPEPTPQAHVRKPKRKKKSTVRQPKNAAELSRLYVNTMRVVGQKSMVRMDPSIKRTLCKHCDTVLIPGSTVCVRVRPLPSHGLAVQYTCMSCRAVRMIPAPAVLDPDVSHIQEAPPNSESDTVASTSRPVDEPASTMEVDPPDVPPLTKRQSKGVRRVRKRVARVPPLFERKGHVVFRGNEVLVE